MTDKPEKAEQIGPMFAFRCPICHYRIWCGRPCTFDPDRPIASPPHELSNLVFTTPPLLEARKAERDRTRRNVEPKEHTRKSMAKSRASAKRKVQDNG